MLQNPGPIAETPMLALRSVLTAVAIAVLVTGCNNMQVRTATGSAKLAPTRGNHVEGDVSFLQKGELLLVSAKISGLAPGLHGFHIHEKGDCSAPDASSAGAHFNPTRGGHGGPEGTERHAGDLGNLIADSAGTAVFRAEVSGITLGTKEDTSIIGRAVVIHASVDDLISQPSGNSGARVACGLISLSPEKWFHNPQ